MSRVTKDFSVVSDGLTTKSKVDESKKCIAVIGPRSMPKLNRSITKLCLPAESKRTTTGPPVELPAIQKATGGVSGISVAVGTGVGVDAALSLLSSELFPQESAKANSPSELTRGKLMRKYRSKETVFMNHLKCWFTEF